MKRIVSVLLVVCVLTSMISVGIVTSSASTISSSDDYYTYKESYIKNYCTYDYLVNEMRLPYRAFVETLDKDTAFQVELDAWKLATISPDSLATEITQTQQCKYYEAILIDLLVRNTQEESFIENVQSFKDSIHVSAWKKYVDYNSNILIDTPITSENADAILKEIKSMGNFGKALEYADTISDYIDYAVDISDLFDKLSKLEMIAQMSESYAEVLNIMSSKCGNNVYLNTAIDNVALVFSKDLTVEQIKSIFIAKSAPYVVFEEFMKEAKKQVISYLGMAGLAIDLAQSVGTVVANSWFGTEDMINDYYEMSSLYEIEDLLRTAVLNTNGSTFCAAFKMYENICLMGCDYSKKYVEPLYTSLFGKLFAWATNQNYENYSAQLDDLKKQLSFMFEMIDVGADSWYVIDTGNTENMNAVNESFTITQYRKEDYNNQNEDIKLDAYSTYGSNRGYDITLTKDMVINNNFVATGGTIDLNGHTLTINGNLQQTNGTIYINGGALNVNGNYTIGNDNYDRPYPILNMTNEKDKVIVKGDFTTNSTADHKTCLTAGVMEVKGNFSANYGGSYSGYCFNATGNHKVVFNGTEKQNIHFDNAFGSGFSDVDFQNPNIEFDSEIRGWVLKRDTVINNDCIFSMNDKPLDLNGHTLTINGNLQQTSGTIFINGGTLKVKGDYSIENDNSPFYPILNMTNENDIVLIEGDFTTNSQVDHLNYLTSGVMEIKGDFCSLHGYSYSGYSFNASGTHKVIFNGTEKQNIYFDDAYKSGFADVDFQNSNIEFDSEIRGWVLKRNTVINNDCVFSIKDKPLDLNGHTLTINGNLQQTNGTIYINGGALNVNGNYTIGNDNYDRPYPILNMTNEKDKVIVKGDFTTNSTADHKTCLTAGVMEVKGNFSANYGGSYSGYCFNATGNHKVVFNGTEKQNIHFDNAFGSGFSDVDFQNPNIEFDSEIRGWVLKRDTVINNDCIFSMNDKPLDLNGHTLTINGNLQQTSGTIFINGGTLKVKGDYSIENDNSPFYPILNMTKPNDVVVISGNYSTESYSSHDGLLTDGTMYIKGDFSQMGNSDSTFCHNYENFKATDNHKVVLCGENTQKISFEGSSSYFNILELTKDRETGYVFNRDNCWNELIITKKPIIGDVNSDGVISIADTTTLQKYLANIVDFDDEQFAVADTNGDGSVSIADATQIQKYLAQLIPSLG